jgi:hypothetical protein
MNMPAEQIKVTAGHGLDHPRQGRGRGRRRDRRREGDRARHRGGALAGGRTFIARDFDPGVSSVRLVVEGNGWVTATADVAAPAPAPWVASVEVVLAHEEPGPDPSPPRSSPSGFRAERACAFAAAALAA